MNKSKFNDEIDLDTTTEGLDEDAFYDVDSQFDAKMGKKVAVKLKPEQIEGSKGGGMKLRKEQTEAALSTTLSKVKEPPVSDSQEQLASNPYRPIELEFRDKTFKKILLQYEKAKAKFDDLKEAKDFRILLDINEETGAMDLNFSWDIPKQFKTGGIKL